MGWVDGWMRDVVYMLTGIGIAFILALTYTVLQLLLDKLHRGFTQQPSQPQKVEGKVKQPMGFL